MDSLSSWLAWVSYTIPRSLLKVLYHKALIFLFGLYVNWLLRKTSFAVSVWRLIIHDYSKFSFLEFFVYARHYFGQSGGAPDFPIAFKHHTEYNDHHAEHYWRDFKYPSTAEERRTFAVTARVAPPQAVVETIVAWMAAAVSYEGALPRVGQWKWPKAMSDNTGFHAQSELLLHALLAYLGYWEEMGGITEFSRKCGVARRSARDAEWQRVTSDMVAMLRLEPHLNEYATFLLLA